MGQASESQVRELLRDHSETLVSIFQGAWNDWRSAGLPHWRCKRSRATFVWEQMMEHAHQAFSVDPRVHIHRRDETYLFVLDGALVFRLKKGDEAGTTANIPTQSVMAFHDPEQELPGIPEVARVDIVYVLNKLETALSDVLVVGKDRGEVQWSYSVMPKADIVGLPISGQEPVPSQPGQYSGLVRPKGSRKKPEADQEGR